MSSDDKSDEATVARARQLIATSRRGRWPLLLLAAMFLGLAIYATALGVRRIEDLDELSSGFVFGLGLAVVWTTFGLMGAFCLAKFLLGVERDFRTEELLLRYNDRLRDLGQLPDQRPVEERRKPDGAQKHSRS